MVEDSTKSLETNLDVGDGRLKFGSEMLAPSVLLTAGLVRAYQVPETSGLCRLEVTKMRRRLSLRVWQALLHPECQRNFVELPTTSRRCFRSSANQQTDGVYKALTEMRVRTPWIEALRQNQGIGTQEADVPSEPVKLDLTPKRMSDSYFKCVWIP